MGVYENRQEEKARWQKYRDAAKRLHPTASFNPACHVAETAAKDGAFIEMTVWIPHSEITDDEGPDQGRYDAGDRMDG